MATQHRNIVRIHKALSTVLVAALALTMATAAEARPANRLLTSSKLGYVPGKKVTKGPWIKRVVTNHRVRKAQRLQSKIEGSLDTKRRPGNLFGLIKQGRYHNMVLRGQTDNGTPVTVITGKHRGFPFVSKKGNWDNFQVKVGNKSYAINHSDMSRLKISFKGKGDNKKVKVSYDGVALEQKTTSHRMQDYDKRRLPAPVSKGYKPVSFQVEMSAKSLGMLPMGVTGVMGMEYFPNKVQATAKGKLTVGSKVHGFNKAAGELETGRMSNLSKKRVMAAVYDYRGVAGEGGVGHVAFVGKGAGTAKKGALSRGLAKVMNGVARVMGTRSFGFGPEGMRHNKTLQVRDGRIVGHDVIQFPNGVTLERRMVEVKDNAGKTHRGLQERFF